MPHRVRDTMCLILNRWLENRNLSAPDRDAVERIAAVGMALHHHRSGQHHRKRHGCEDKAHEFQPATVRHRHSLMFTASVELEQHQVHNALPENSFRGPFVALILRSRALARRLEGWPRAL